MAPQTDAQRTAHLQGQIKAVTWDLRQARADDDQVTAGILEQTRDDLIAEVNRLAS